MSLCSLCAAIPWEDLPSVPRDLSAGLTGHEYIQPVFQWPADIRGYPHHQSLDALRESASSCHLCRQIRISADKVEKQLETLKPTWEAGESEVYDWPLWELFLVKRSNGGDGCWVMTFVDKSVIDNREIEKNVIDEAWIVAALGICVEDGSPLDSVIHGRPVEATGDTPIAIGRAQKWLDTCHRHSGCTIPDTELPSRVIDVGEDLESPHVRLWEPVPKGFVAPYICLSYCWGASPEFTTTKATLEEKKRGMLISDMPATYRDVVKIARKLKIRYIWIDGLCICQDDHENWERESAKMQAIYSNSHLTVFASRAKESAEGFLGQRPSRDYVALKYARNGLEGHALAFSLPLLEELITENYIKRPEEPLSQRAWGLQERVLSRRNLIYGVNQMFFECNDGFRGEDGLFLSERYHSIHKSLQIDRAEQPQNTPGHDSAKVHSRPKRAIMAGWHHLLWEYGPRNLTLPSDKLPAMSGLAAIYADLMGEDYLAGLWRGNLLEGMLWQGLSFRRVSEYRAPSWSWASGDGIPATGQNQDYDELAQILDAQVVLKGANPYGEVGDGWIKLRAPMEQLFMMTEGWDPEQPGHLPYDNNVKVRTKNGHPEGDYSRFDFAFTAEDAPQEAKRIVKSLEGVDIFALILIKSHPWSGVEETGGYQTLIVKKAGEPDRYERLGFLLCDEEMLGYRPEERAVETWSILTLV